MAMTSRLTASGNPLMRDITSSSCPQQALMGCGIHPKPLQGPNRATRQAFWGEEKVSLKFRLSFPPNGAKNGMY